MLSTIEIANAKITKFSERKNDFYFVDANIMFEVKISCNSALKYETIE
jgi:hypothetical protein